ncbi:MAG TPA: hypothetical protein VJL81_02415 [Solirubrobacterales bacterium]|nr:hypothetical protein [Solirubrobacterales bacterium]
MWRWLSADPREVVDLAGAGALATGVDERHLGEELRRWRGIVARRRLVALARRHGAVALGLAAVLEVLALLDLFPQWVVVAVPLAVFLVSVAVFASQGPSPFGLARLLDDKLGLNDRLATALEIGARGGQESPLERRTVADAAGLLAAGREDWHASAARAGRYDWSVLGGVVMALAVVVAIALATGGSSSPTPTQALGPNGGAGAVGGPNANHKKKAEKKSPQKPLAPTGKLHKVEGKKRPEISSVQTQNQGYQQIPQGKESGRKGKAATGKGGNGEPKGQAGRATKGSNTQSNNHKGSPNNGKGPSTEGNKEKEHPTVGFSVKGQKKHKGSGRKGASEVSGAGAKKSSPNGQQDETTASSQAAPKGGTPTGAGKAGGEQGNSRQGHVNPVTGQASQAVKIQPGYAPSRSRKGGKEKNKAPGNEEGAGGKARTAQVTGATQVGEEFSFVPAAGGAVPGASAGLQQNYLESLKWVARLPW